MPNLKQTASQFIFKVLFRGSWHLNTLNAFVLSQSATCELTTQWSCMYFIYVEFCILSFYTKHTAYKNLSPLLLNTSATFLFLYILFEIMQNKWVISDDLKPEKGWTEINMYCSMKTSQREKEHNYWLWFKWIPTPDTWKQKILVAQSLLKCTPLHSDVFFLLTQEKGF